jgi:hypothetical protein
MTVEEDETSKGLCVSSSQLGTVRVNAFELVMKIHNLIQGTASEQ